MKKDYNNTITMTGYYLIIKRKFKNITDKLQQIMFILVEIFEIKNIFGYTQLSSFKMIKIRYY